MNRHSETRLDVPIKALLSDAFIREHSSYTSLETLLGAGGFDINSKDDLKAIPEATMDAHIKASTCFNAWSDMLQHAAAEYVKRHPNYQPIP